MYPIRKQSSNLLLKSAWMTRMTYRNFALKLTWQTHLCLQHGEESWVYLWMHLGWYSCHPISTVPKSFCRQLVNHPQRVNKRRWKEPPRANQAGHSLTITPKEKQINKERKGSKIKINTNRKKSSQRGLEVRGGGLRTVPGCVFLVKSQWECIIWALHRSDPEHSPLHWAFLPTQIEGLPQEEVLWLGTIGIYPLLICGIEEANPWQ